MQRMVWGLLSVGLALSAQAAEVEACLDCHGGSGRRALAPNLDGQHAAYLQAQLTRFREHAREAFPMEALAQGLDDGLVSELAVAFSQRVWTSPALTIDPQTIEQGHELLQRFDCAACHGAAFLGGGEVPRLAGQQPDYLQRQLRAFGADERAHPPSGTGAPLRSLDDDQRAAIAAALAAFSDPR